MFGRLLRVTSTVLVIAVAFVTPVLVTATATPAGADTVADGCTIVSNPTATNFTNCPGADLTGANLSGVDLSFANLSGATFVQCTAQACDAASLSDANLTNANLSSATLSALFVVIHSSVSISGVDMSGAILSGANLGGDDMTEVDLTAATLTDANLEGVVLAKANLTNANLGGADLTNATFTNESFLVGSGGILTGADFTGATLTGVDFTGTTLIPSDQTIVGTSAGAVVTWSTPQSLPGATPGSCTPPSGSTFPLGSTTVTCQVLDNQGDVATGTFIVEVVVPPPTTAVGLPSNGATITGGTFLDASASSSIGIASVTYEVSGGTLSDHVISGSTPTIVGWLGGWNTTTVPNGSYTLQSVATDVDGVSTTSAPITVTVNNPPPTTVVGLPSNGATIKGGTLLDASASAGVTSVSYELTGGTLSDQVISGSTPTIVGWLGGWDSTTVPNGSYTIQSVACYAGGVCGASAPVNITVSN